MNEKKEKYFLQFLLATNINQQRVIISHTTKIQMSVIIEIIFNALRGNLSLSKDIKNKLNRYRHVIRQLVLKRLAFKKRKMLLLKYWKQVIQLITPCQTWLKS